MSKHDKYVWLRRYLYGVCIAGFTVLGTYGYLDDQQMTVWAYLAAALFGIPLANTHTTGGDDNSA